MQLEEWFKLYGSYIAVALNKRQESPSEAAWWNTVALTLDNERRGQVRRFDQVRLR